MQFFSMARAYVWLDQSSLESNSQLRSKHVMNYDLQYLKQRKSPKFSISDPSNRNYFPKYFCRLSQSYLSDVC